ncbi:MAG: alpha/beta fold hydrolase [Acidobacteriota bacterium]|nr:alpha/beta fold hydrolase [Acidobacteriota bacterium]
MSATLESDTLLLESGQPLAFRIAHRRIGTGPVKVLLLHALTGGQHPEGEHGWWGPLFHPGWPLDPAKCTVWAPNLIGSCHGSTGPDMNEGGPPGRFAPSTSPLVLPHVVSGQSPVATSGGRCAFPDITPRDQAAALARWLESEHLTFDALVGGSLGGMVALELALLAPERFKTVAAIGSGGRSDGWIWGTHQIQRAILESDLPDHQAVALARHAAMLTFRAPVGINSRFESKPQIQEWLRHHGEALSARFTRASYLTLLSAMDAHDLGRGRGGLVEALKGLKAPLHVLGLSSDQLFTAPLIHELADAAEAAGTLGSLKWINSAHGHDAFLIEWDQVGAWLGDVLKGAA